MKKRFVSGIKPGGTRTADFRSHHWWGLCSLLLWVAFVSGSVRAEPLKLLTFAEKPLVDWDNEQPAGVLVRVVEELMRRAQVDYEMQLLPPKRATLMAESMPNHCVFPIERSQEREVFYQWVSPVIISRHAVYSHPSIKIPLITLDDMRPYNLGSYLGSGAGEYLESFGMHVEYASRNELNLGKLMKKRIDLWVSDQVSADYMAKTDRVKLGTPELVFFTTVRAMGCNLGVDKQLIKRMQKTVTAMYRDKTVDRIYADYFEKIN